MTFGYFRVFYRAFFNYIYDYFYYTNTDRINVYAIKKPILGPMNFCEYIFHYKNRTYRVILDTDITTFDTFEQQLMRSKLPCIPNRGLMSESINIDKFNSFMGPCCDFYKSCDGVLSPYSIDFFIDSSIECENKYVYDTRGVCLFFNSMEKTNFYKSWICDCTN